MRYYVPGKNTEVVRYRTSFSLVVCPIQLGLFAEACLAIPGYQLSQNGHKSTYYRVFRGGYIGSYGCGHTVYVQYSYMCTYCILGRVDHLLHITFACHTKEMES